MKKLMSLIIASALLISMVAGCDPKEYDNVSEPSDVSSEKVIFNEQGCIDILNRFFDCQLGTAGASIKIGLVAVDVLNWTEANEADTDTVAITVQKFYDGLDDDMRSEFKQCYDKVNDTALDIISGSNDIFNFLEDNSADIQSKSYSADKYKVFTDAVEKVIG